MRILFVLPAYEPAWTLGGVVRCTSNLCRALVSQGHRVTVYTLDTDGQGRSLDIPTDAAVERGGVHVRYFPSTLGPGSLWDSRALVRALNRRVDNFDVVYVSAVWQWLGFETARICHQKGVPLVFGTHGSLDRRVLKTHRLRKMIYWHLVLKRALRRVSAIHFTTEYERSESQVDGLPSFVVPNGLDTKHFTPTDSSAAVRRRYAIPPEAPLALVVGRVDPKKRLDLLISALAEVDGVYLAIVGPDDSPLADEHRLLSRQLDVQQRVIWTGYQTGRDLVDLYSAADVFTLLSQDENFGMVVVEAMACGVPVLVSRYVGVWHAVKDEDVGMAVRMTPQRIAEALGSLTHARSVWEKRGRRAQEVARERFASDRVARLMAVAFEDLRTGRRSPCCSWEIPTPAPARRRLKAASSHQ